MGEREREAKREREIERGGSEEDREGKRWTNREREKRLKLFGTRNVSAHITMENISLVALLFLCLFASAPFVCVWM